MESNGGSDKNCLGEMCNFSQNVLANYYEAPCQLSCRNLDTWLAFLDVPVNEETTFNDVMSQTLEKASNLKRNANASETERDYANTIHDVVSTLWDAAIKQKPIKDGKRDVLMEHVMKSEGYNKPVKNRCFGRKRLCQKRSNEESSDGEPSDDGESGNEESDNEPLINQLGNARAQDPPETDGKSQAPKSGDEECDNESLITRLGNDARAEVSPENGGSRKKIEWLDKEGLERLWDQLIAIMLDASMELDEKRKRMAGLLTHEYACVLPTCRYPTTNKRGWSNRVAVGPETLLLLIGKTNSTDVLPAELRETVTTLRKTCFCCKQTSFLRFWGAQGFCFEHPSTAENILKPIASSGKNAKCQKGATQESVANKPKQADNEANQQVEEAAKETNQEAEKAAEKAAKKANQEAEEAAKEANQEAEEANQRKREAEEAEKAAEEAANKANQEAEGAKKRKREAEEAANKANQEAEGANKRKREAEEAAKKAKQETEEANKRKREAEEAAKKANQEAEGANKRKREAEEAANKANQEAEGAKKRKREAEKAEEANQAVENLEFGNKSTQIEGKAAPSPSSNDDKGATGTNHQKMKTRRHKKSPTTGQKVRALGHAAATGVKKMTNFALATVSRTSAALAWGSSAIARFTDPTTAPKGDNVSDMSLCTEDDAAL